MSKQNNHRLKMPTTTGPRYRWNLPDDVRAVKLAAFAQGMINAAEQKKAGLALSKDAIQAGSIDAALLVEQEKRGGKQGASDAVLFRQTFSAMCAVIWEATYAYWQESPEVYTAFVARPGQQRIANAVKMAERYLEPVEQKIKAGKPVVFDW